LAEPQLISPDRLVDIPQVEVLNVGFYPTGKLNSGKPDMLTKTFTDLLKDPDRDVRDYAVTLIRFARPGYTGQPLKPGDFPEIYEQAQETK
jgi:hypothetical protein